MTTHRNENYTAASIISLTLHSAVIGIFLWGAVETQIEEKPKGNSINAVFVDPSAVRAQANQIRLEREKAKNQEAARLRHLEQNAKKLENQQKQEAKRLDELKNQRRLAELEMQKAESERKRVNAAKKKALDEKREAEAFASLAKKQAQEAQVEHQRQLEEKKKEQEALLKAKAEREKAEKKTAEAKVEREKAEKKAAQAKVEREKAEKKAAEAKAKQAEQEAALNEMFSGLESESASRSSARGELVHDEAKQWASRFEGMIQQNWIVDSSMSGQKCRLNLRLAPDGLVIDVSTLSGDAALCRSASASVLKVSKFPMPSDSDVVVKLRDLNLNFER